MKQPTKNYTLLAEAELEANKGKPKIGPTDDTPGVATVDEAIVAERLGKAYEGHTQAEISQLRWTDKVLLAQGKEIQWPNVQGQKGASAA